MLSGEPTVNVEMPMLTSESITTDPQYGEGEFPVAFDGYSGSVNQCTSCDVRGVTH